MLRRLLVPLCLLVLACGSESPPPADATGPSTGPSTGDTVADTTTSAPTTTLPTTGVSTSDAGTTADDTPTTTAVASTTDTTSAGTTSDETTSASTTDGDSSSSGDTLDEEGVEYAAYFWAGGLDHIFIYKADTINDHCTTLHLAWPVDFNPEFAIEAPGMWGALDAQVTPGTAGCLAGMPEGDSFFALDGSGVVDFEVDAMNICPSTLDVAATLAFAPDDDWVPEAVQFAAIDLAVAGCL